MMSYRLTAILNDILKATPDLTLIDDDGYVSFASDDTRSFTKIRPFFELLTAFAASQSLESEKMLIDDPRRRGQAFRGEVFPAFSVQAFLGVPFRC